MDLTLEEIHLLLSIVYREMSYTSSELSNTHAYYDNSRRLEQLSNIEMFAENLKRKKTLPFG